MKLLKIPNINYKEAELYTYRNTLFSLIKSQFYGKYRNSILGIGWNFLTPLITMFVYYVAFSTIRSGGLENKWLFIASGVFLFNYLAGCITNGSTCITSYSGMVKKMYFPREILVIANACTKFIVVLIGYGITITLSYVTGCPPDISKVILFIPLLLISFIFGIGIMLIISSINVYMRDLQYGLSSLNMVLFFLTPMYFIAKDAEGLLGQIIWYNPLTYFVEICHDLLYWGTCPSILNWAIVFLISVLFLFLGCVCFKRLKGGFAEKL